MYTILYTMLPDRPCHGPDQRLPQWGQRHDPHTVCTGVQYSVQMYSTVYRYGLGRSEREMLDVLVALSDLSREIPTFVTMLRKKDVEQLIGQYELEAKCFYDKAAQSKSTVFKKFTEMVSKDQYSEYVKELFGAVQQMFKSDKLEKNIILVYEKIVDESKQIDVNACTGKLYFFLLNFRGFLLNIDIQQVITHINQIYREFDEGMWKTSHGEWPEMAKCLDNIIRLSFGSREFWVKLGILS